MTNIFLAMLVGLMILILIAVMPPLGLLVLVIAFSTLSWKVWRAGQKLKQFLEEDFEEGFDNKGNH